MPIRYFIFCEDIVEETGFREISKRSMSDRSIVSWQSIFENRFSDYYEVACYYHFQ